MANFIFCIFSIFTALILLLSSSITAQTSDNIQVGKSLTATKTHSPLLSSAGDFAFGFHQFLNHTNLYLLAIWYAKIPDTIVWYANEGNPVSEGSTVTLTATEGLMLSDPQGSHLWNTSDNIISGSEEVSYGYINDTGNFIIKSSSNDLLWQSFDFPTDTLLPTQAMNKDGKINSRLSETNFTQGRFQLHLQGDGNLVFNVMDLTTYSANTQPYYASGTWKPPNQGNQVIYNKSGHMYIVASNGTILYNFIPEDKISSIGDYYQRMTLNFYGVLTWYYHPRNFTKSNEVGWFKMYSLPGNICSVGCGYNSICTYDEKAQNVMCNCPSNYSLIDPGDRYGSCKPNFEQWEEDGQDMVTNIKLVELPNTFFDECEERYQSISEEQCKHTCQNDRFCAVATWDTDGGGTCCKKKPLFSGKYNSSVAKSAWLKVGNGTLSPSAILPEAKSKVNIVLLSLLGGILFVTLISLGVATFLIYNKKQLKCVEPLEEYNNVHCFSYKVLKDATDDFKEELGRGAFGVVYKGMIKARGSPTFVAVKKLDRLSNHADKEFETEVNVIGMTHHKNLVRLVGFCKENDQRLLVYEYMSNGSLADYLFGGQRPNWIARTQIAQGIASGLQYLHEQCNTQIIHCDIKPHNILIDNYQNARISDFGIAKLLAIDHSYTNTAIRGTKGYVAPEWFKNKPITVKVDVYSFGVLLLEIICCRKNVRIENMEEQRAILTDWAFDCYQFNTLENLVDNDMETLHDKLQFCRFVMVALWCIQEDPNLRPTMKMVTLMLEGFAEVPNPPCPSFPTSYLSTMSG